MSTVELVSIDLAVQLGTSTMPVHQMLRMGRGAVIALDQNEADDVILLAHNTPIASAQILVQGEHITVKINKMLPLPPERRRSAKPMMPAAEDVAEEAAAHVAEEAAAHVDGEAAEGPADS